MKKKYLSSQIITVFFFFLIELPMLIFVSLILKGSIWISIPLFYLFFKLYVVLFFKKVILIGDNILVSGILCRKALYKTSEVDYIKSFGLISCLILKNGRTKYYIKNLVLSLKSFKSQRDNIEMSWINEGNSH